MKPEIAAIWTPALRSGEYKQGKGNLQRGDAFCCLGVLCDLAVKAGVPVKREVLDSGLVLFDSKGGYLPYAVKKWAGMGTEDGLIRNTTRLANLNDSGAPFSEIADAIEAHVADL